MAGKYVETVDPTWVATYTMKDGVEVYVHRDEAPSRPDRDFDGDAVQVVNLTCDRLPAELRRADEQWYLNRNIDKVLRYLNLFHADGGRWTYHDRVGYSQGDYVEAYVWTHGGDEWAEAVFAEHACWALGDAYTTTTSKDDYWVGGYYAENVPKTDILDAWGYSEADVASEETAY